MAEYKEECKNLKAYLKNMITEVTKKKGTAKTTVQKKVCDNFIAASKKCQNALNTCDANCTCKNKTPNAGNTCIQNAYKKLEPAQNAYYNTMGYE